VDAVIGEVREMVGGANEGYLYCEDHSEAFFQWCAHKEKYIAEGRDGSEIRNNSVVQIPVFPSVSNMYGWVRANLEIIDGQAYAQVPWPTDHEKDIGLGFLLAGEGRLALRATFIEHLRGLAVAMHCRSSIHNPLSQTKLSYDIGHGDMIVQKFFIWSKKMCKTCTIQTETMLYNPDVKAGA
jgi:hypothetical protein